ncbi:MAG TPA: hypothetical protein DCY49_00765 [Candidatus Jacksonbacteria bacterium]|nr:hypothetical protein [Candidatus Jacksonbacteria bacterium]
MTMNKKSLIIIFILAILIALSLIGWGMRDRIISIFIKTQEQKDEGLLKDIRLATQKEDWDEFGKLMAQVYEQRLIETNKEYNKVESEAYVKATTYLDQEKDPQKALDVATKVYELSPYGWRFNYLKVRALETLGKQAFAEENAQLAESYAMQILTIQYRLEGANLLADIYIKKIEEALKAGGKDQALQAYLAIKDYEVSQDRKDKLNQLARQL